MLKIRKRKKMKTQRLITIVAVVAIVLSLSVVGISAAGTSIAKPTSQSTEKSKHCQITNSEQSQQ